MAGLLRQTLKLVLLAIALLVSAMVFGLIPLDLSFARERIARAVLDSTGLEVKFQGALSLRLGPAPQVSAGLLTVENPAASDLQLARVDKLQASLRLLPLLGRKVYLRSITVSNARVDICGDWPLKKAGQGRSDNNLQSQSRPAKPAGPAFSFDALEISSIEVHCSDQQRNLPMLPAMLKITASAAPGKPVNLSLDGDELMLRASGGSLTDLWADPQAFPLKLELDLSTSRLSLEGELSRPFSDPRLSTTLNLQVPNPGELLDLLDIHPLNLPAFSVSAGLNWRTDEIGLERLNGVLETDSFAGSAVVSWTDERPRYDLFFEAPRLDVSLFREASGPIDETESPTGASPGTQGFDLGPIFSQLAQFDSSTRVEIGKLYGLTLPVEDLKLNLKLLDSALTLETGTAVVADTPLLARAQLGLGSSCPQLSAHVEFSNFKTESIAGQLEKDWPLGVQLDQAKLDSTSCGSDTLSHRDSFKVKALLHGLSYSMAGQQEPLILQQVSINAASQAPGHLQMGGVLHEQNFTAVVELAPLEDVFSARSWPIKATLASGDGRLALDGRAVIAGEDSSLAAQLNLHATSVGRAFAWAGANPQSGLSLDASSEIALSRSGGALDRINIQLGRSDLTGSMGYSMAKISSGQSSAAHAVLRSELLDLQQMEDLWLPDSLDSTPGQSGLANEKQPSMFTGTPVAELFNSVDLDLEIAQIQGDKLDMTAAVLHAGIHQGLIDNAIMSINLEGVPLHGELDADFRTLPWRLAYDFGASEVDIGRLLGQLELAQASDMKADAIDAQLSTSGRDLVSMAQNTNLDIVVKNFLWATRDPSGLVEHSFEFEHLAVNLGPDQPTTWETRGLYNGTKINARVHSPDIKTTADPTAPLPLIVIAGSGTDVFKISTQIDRSFDHRLKAEMVISGQKMKSDDYDLSSLPDILGDYELQSGITLTPGQMDFDNIRIRVGSSHLDGDLHLEDQADKKSVTLKLHGTRVETEDFVAMAEEWRQIDRSKNPADTDGATGGTVESYEGMFRVFDEQIRAISQSRIFDIRLDIDDLFARGETLGEAHFGLSSDDNHFTLEPVNIALPGGVVDANYTRFEKNGRTHAALNIDIEKLEYSGLLRLLSPKTPDAGEIYVQASIQAEAADRDGLTAALQGSLELGVFPENIGAEVLDLWATNLVLALLPVSLGEKAPKKINCLVARLTLENGIMKPKIAFLDTTAVILRGRGTIDLVERNLDLLVAPQAKSEKFFSISSPIAVTGSFDDFKVGLAPGSFMTTMFRWFYGGIYVPYKWLTGQRFPADGLETCYHEMDWELPAGDAR